MTLSLSPEADSLVTIIDQISLVTEPFLASMTYLTN